jgi:hypothetical protein
MRIPVDLGFLYVAKLNLFCSRCILRYRKFNFLLDSFSSVKIVDGSIVLNSVNILSTCVLFPSR